MAEFKFNIGDKVILDYPDYAMFNGEVCTVKDARYSRILDSNLYLVEERFGWFNENRLILHKHKQPEQLVSNMDLSQLFKEGL